MVISQGVILAAGRGTRLGSLTDDAPKPMLEVGGSPLIDHIVAAMVDAGVRSLVVVTGYHADAIERHLAATALVPVVFVRQTAPTGTAAALRLAASAVGFASFLLSWGDIATASDHFTQVAAAWAPELAAVIGVNRVADVSRGAAVVFGDDKSISAIVEKPKEPPPSHWNNAGLMVLGPEIWPHLAALEPSPRGELELPDAINAVIGHGGRAIAVKLDGLWFDIGTRDNLLAAQDAFRPQ